MSVLSRTLLVSGALATAALFAAGPKDPLPVPTTLMNLQTAYNGESNAHAKYLAYAEQAKAEGFHKVATLFQAAARSEEIHAANHAEVIRKMGGTPQADVKPVTVASTRENLEDALKGETYERDRMYPSFLTKARKDGNPEAIRTLNLARNAEIEHAKLYQEALGDLEGWKAAGASFVVCPVCGWTATALPAERCPSSFTPRARFLTIS